VAGDAVAPAFATGHAGRRVRRDRDCLTGFDRAGQQQPDDDRDGDPEDQETSGVTMVAQRGSAR
jgi:hypothetical protein